MKKKTQKLVIYTKFCLDCVTPEFWDIFRKRAFGEGYSLKVIRTAYRPFSHKKASSIWGDDSYFAFVVFPNGDAMKMERAIDMWDEAKNKMVKSGKKKSTKKGGRKDGVLGVSETTRTVRVDSVEDTGVETKVKTERVD